MEQQLHTAISELKRVAGCLTTSEQGVSMEDFRNWTTFETYDAGCDDGKIYQARHILETLGITW